MKLHQFGILFIILAAVYLLGISYKKQLVVDMKREYERMNQCLETAVDDSAGALLSSTTGRTIIYSKNEAVNRFYGSLYSSLGITDQPMMQARIQQCTPIFIVTDEDGFYVLYSQVEENEKYSSMKKCWSEKYYFVYEDEYFVYRFTFGSIVTIYDKHHLVEDKTNQSIITLDYHQVNTAPEYASFRTKHPSHFLLNEHRYQLIRQHTIMEVLEKKMKYYINQHNYVVKQCGIEYECFLPETDNALYAREVDQYSILVLFQGYPLKDEKHYFNRFDFVGAKMRQKNAYYLEKRKWYLCYHKVDCPLIQSGQVKVDYNNPIFSEEDAAKHGAYGCKKCLPQSIPEPE